MGEGRRIRPRAVVMAMRYEDGINVGDVVGKRLRPAIRRGVNKNIHAMSLDFKTERALVRLSFLKGERHMSHHRQLHFRHAL